MTQLNMQTTTDPRNTSRVEIIHSERDVTFSTAGDVFIVIWHRDTTLEGVAKLNDYFDLFAEKHIGGVGLYTIVEPEATLPSADARDGLATFMRQHGGVIRASAVVHEGTGFRAAAVRGVVTGLTLLARQPFPHKIFSTVAAANGWFVENLTRDAQESGSPQVLLNSIRSARAVVHRRAHAAH